ncbi:hypothetical protein SAMN04488548_13125 [Gordonia westfalica]|uniref:Uncharacterized protein n=1 Tax=Gordonia westfalica TaxID=158898 RepID=A0A1H2DQ05_9ACTN|nr:hypothetical protein [Gordonia westfalica]SDT84708.1 hypothetical protein SAMN04488548_11027 [Gordonia westfalica]SDT84896.1 hypothetical protein SAMN04488548_11219 [Gordonia westfalica]SDT85127.1 hypothetical protein SAMN04488548_11527 [Gordonia westfalica]SDT94334.1 hypothetical protein SAMN04488548_13125 [Gordonia westfalica]
MADPVWLPDVLRAEGLKVDIYPGAFERGHGDFGTIWGPFMHHTGSFGETPRVSRSTRLSGSRRNSTSRRTVLSRCAASASHGTRAPARGRASPRTTATP